MRPHLVTLIAASLIASTAFAQPANQTKTFIFPEIHSGVCTLDHATLTLQSNGTGVLQATTATGAALDEAMTVQLYGETTDNTTLFFSGNFTSPRMAPGQTYNWTGKMKFDPGLLPAVNHIRVWSSC